METFTIAPTAQTKIEEIIAAESVQDMKLRIRVRPGGCSGFVYELVFDHEQQEDDQTLTYENFTAIIDSASSQLLQGATLTYDDGLNGQGFKFNNPNASRSCGCGQSFS